MWLVIEWQNALNIFVNTFVYFRITMQPYSSRILSGPVLPNMLVAQYLVLMGVLFLTGSYLAKTEDLLTVLEFPVAGVADSKDGVEYSLENTEASAFTICFYFKPAYQLNTNLQILLKVLNFLTIGIYEDSVGGWLEIQKENIIFDFPEALLPRTWNSFCIQQTSKERKVWHENKIIYFETLKDIPAFTIQVFN